MIRTLASGRAGPPGKPERADVPATQWASRALAEDPSVWSPWLARETLDRYAELAPVWNDERGGYRRVPVEGALARCGPLPDGWCGRRRQGLLTRAQAARWPRVLCLDLSWELLSRGPARRRVLADGAALTLAGRSAAAVVLGDAPLLAGEVVRLLPSTASCCGRTGSASTRPITYPSPRCSRR